MEEEDRENDDDEWYGCVELKEGRCKWKSKRSDQSEEGSRFKSPLAIPRGMEPLMPRLHNTSVVATAITAPTIRFPATKPRIIWFRFVMNRVAFILESKKPSIRIAI
jgi:hypothetical protein